MPRVPPQFPKGTFVEGVLTTPPATRRVLLLSLLWGLLIGSIAQLYFGFFASGLSELRELWRWLAFAIAALWLGGRLGRLVPAHLPLRAARRGGTWGGNGGGLGFSLLVMAFASAFGNSDAFLQGADAFGRLLAATCIGACIGYQVWLPFPPEPEPLTREPASQPEPQPPSEPEVALPPVAAPEPIPDPEPEAREAEPELETPAETQAKPQSEPEPQGDPPLVVTPRAPAPSRPEVPRVTRGRLGRPTSARDAGLGRPSGLGRENSIGRRWTP